MKHSKCINASMIQLIGHQEWRKKMSLVTGKGVEHLTWPTVKVNISSTFKIRIMFGQALLMFYHPISEWFCYVLFTYQPTHCFNRNTSEVFGLPPHLGLRRATRALPCDRQSRQGGELSFQAFPRSIFHKIPPSSF